MKVTFVDKIGPGGFGIVDKVKDEKGVEYARKTFQINNPGFPKKLVENARQRFKREAKFQKAISHKNIVPVLHEELEEDPPFYIMPLAVCSLQDDMEVDKTLNGKFMDAIIDIIAGLEELHSVEIKHRDLKPANVLRFEDNDNPDRKFYYAISDFGLMAVSQTKISSLTQTGMRMGSDYYTAPEIVKELKDATPQSDIYSLGCILHDFVGTEARIPCDEIREKGDFAAILLSCTRKEPSRRFKSVSAVREAILAIKDFKIKPKTELGAEIFEHLKKHPASLTPDEWKIIVTFIDDEFPEPDAQGVLRKLTYDHIEHLVTSHKDLANKLGITYAKWIRNYGFNFDECDALANRISLFIDNCNLEVQAECIMALLYMGTHHNRWYVERKFTGIVGKSLREDLAKRLAIEFRVDDEDLCQAIRHLRHSIHYDTSNLHPLLLATYKEIC